MCVLYGRPRGFVAVPCLGVSSPLVTNLVALPGVALGGAWRGPGAISPLRSEPSGERCVRSRPAALLPSNLGPGRFCPSPAPLHAVTTPACCSAPVVAELLRRWPSLSRCCPSPRSRPFTRKSPSPTHAGRAAHRARACSPSHQAAQARTTRPRSRSTRRPRPTRTRRSLPLSPPTSSQASPPTLSSSRPTTACTRHTWVTTLTRTRSSSSPTRRRRRPARGAARAESPLLLLLLRLDPPTCSPRHRSSVRRAGADPLPARRARRRQRRASSGPRQTRTARRRRRGARPRAFSASRSSKSARARRTVRCAAPPPRPSWTRPLTPLWHRSPVPSLRVVQARVHVPAGDKDAPATGRAGLCTDRGRSRRAGEHRHRQVRPPLSLSLFLAALPDTGLNPTGSSRSRHACRRSSRRCTSRLPSPPRSSRPTRTRTTRARPLRTRPTTEQTRTTAVQARQRPRRPTRSTRSTPRSTRSRASRRGRGSRSWR